MKDVKSKHKTPINKCRWCGYDKTHKKCPAIGQQCRYCKKMNHFSKFCLSKDVHQLQEVADSNKETEGDCDHEESKDDSLFVYSVKSNCIAEDEQFYEVLSWKILKFTSSWIVVQKLMLCHWALTIISSKDHKLCWKQQILCWFPSPSTDWNLVEKWWRVRNTKIMPKMSRFFVVEPEVESVLHGNMCQTWPTKESSPADQQQTTCKNSGVRWPSRVVQRIRMLAWDVSYWTGWWCYPCYTFPKDDTSTSERESCWRTEKGGKAWSYCVAIGTDRVGEHTRSSSEAQQFSEIVHWSARFICCHKEVPLSYEKVKPWSRWLIAARAYLGFCSMKWLGVFLLPMDGMLVHCRSLPRNLLGFPNNSPVPIYTPGWREGLWELSVLPKNTTLCPQPGLKLDCLLQGRSH